MKFLQRKPKFNGVYLAVLLAVVWLAISLWGSMGATNTTSMAYSKMLSYFENNQVVAFELDQNTGIITMALKEGAVELPKNAKETTGATQQQQAQQPRAGSQVAHGHPPPQPGKGPQQKRIRGGTEQSVGICERIPAGPKPVPMLHGAPLPGVFPYCNILFHRTQGHPGPRDCEPPRKMKVYRYFIRTGGCIFGFS